MRRVPKLQALRSILPRAEPYTHLLSVPCPFSSSLGWQLALVKVRSASPDKVVPTSEHPGKKLDVPAHIRPFRLLRLRSPSPKEGQVSALSPPTVILATP